MCIYVHVHFYINTNIYLFKFCHIVHKDMCSVYVLMYMNNFAIVYIHTSAWKYIHTCLSTHTMYGEILEYECYFLLTILNHNMNEFIFWQLFSKNKYNVCAYTYISNTLFMFNRGFLKLHFQTCCYANACVFFPSCIVWVEKLSFQCY